MRGELSPLTENREFTPIEALVDLVDIASSGGRWTVDISNRSLGRRWKWEHHKVGRFLDRLEGMGKISRPTGAPRTPQVAPHLIVIPPSGYIGGRPSPYPTDAPPVSHPHYNRKREEEGDGLFEEKERATAEDQITENPEIGPGGGVLGIVSPWDLPKTGGGSDDADRKEDK